MITQSDLKVKFPLLTPGQSPPGMFRLNGFGVALYGRRDHDPETNTYVATWCLSLLFIPVLCLRAYRVARASQGWYFLGREPLSAFARRWNLSLLCAILVTSCAIPYSIYTSSPAYQARRQMAAANALVSQGHLGQAAKIYQTLVISETSEADNAAAALNVLLSDECQKAPLSETVDVLRAAAQVARRDRVISRTEVADKAIKLVADKGDSDPRSGVAALDAIRPLVVDTRPLDDRTLSLLRKWAAGEPSNLDAIVPLASILEQRDQLDEAEKLLQPVKNRLGDGEGARVLGRILGRHGDFDGAYALLWPYAKTRLDRLHSAEQSSESALKQLWDREIKLLQEDKAPRDFYENYKLAGEDRQRAMVREYINPRIKNDPLYISAQQSMEREAAVVPVALELGIVMLQRAQGQPNPELRKAQLESAEQVFLAIGGIAGESDAYRLSLGQVYYWLGKQAEGRKLFNDFLTAKSRGFEAIMEIAARLRQLGADGEARTLAEEAYGKGSKSEERQQAALMRSLCHKDLDDEIAWLYKSDTADPRIKASLAKALGEKAFEGGRDDEAVHQARSAIEAYAAMPRSASTLNETALAYYAIFKTTGDRPSLERCQDYFQQAVELNPTDSILLYNAGVTVLDGAVADLIGGDIDLHALHQPGDMALLGYLYHDHADRAALVKRVNEHPGIARAISYLEKVMVLSPKNTRAYAAIYPIHHFTHNEPALRNLEQRLRSAELDTSGQLATHMEMLQGAKDSQFRQSIGAMLKRSEDMAGKLRAKGGRTAAVALSIEVEQMLALDVYGGNVDAGKAVALAEEARRLDASTGTTSVLMAAYVFRAGKELSRSDPAFDASLRKYSRSIGVTSVVANAFDESGPIQQKLLQHPDIRAVVALLKEETLAFPKGHSPYEWQLLKRTDPAEADKAAENIRGTFRKLIEHSIDMLLAPLSGGHAMEDYWLMQITGKPEEGLKSLRKLSAMGIPVPLPAQ